jgi:AcrR family transcriptional regulator
MVRQSTSASEICGTDEAGPETQRERIVHAAFALFMEQGYAGTSTLAIASRARVSKRDLYAEFAGKRDILRACIEERARRMRAPLDLPPARSAAELAAILVRFGATMLTEIADPGVVAVYRLAVAEAQHAPEIAQTLHQAGRESAIAAVAALLAGAQQRGLLGPAPPERMAGQFLALLMGDVLVLLMLGLAAAPDPAAAAERARCATEALFALNPPPQPGGG